ncbi:MAG: ATP-dependent Clp protease adapter ClpS [Syntrophobacterales bacterium]|nr:ATP-dependent Clp protease adapter ClpS [Syntrophobacterales bacterium]
MPHHQQDPDNLSSFLDEADAQTDLREPKMYRVILHNDHYTTMDFVVKILVEVFHKPLGEATKIMMNVHRKGKGVCGVYTYDVALTKVRRVQIIARQSEFPLKCTLEEE